MVMIRTLLCYLYFIKKFQELAVFPWDQKYRLWRQTDLRPHALAPLTGKWFHGS